MRSKDEIWDEAAVDPLHPTYTSQDIFGILNGLFIALVFALIVAEISAQMLNIETRLAGSVETGDQVVQPSVAHDQNELVFGQTIHYFGLS